MLRATRLRALCHHISPGHNRTEEEIPLANEVVPKSRDIMLYRPKVHEGRLKSDIYRTRTKIDILLMAITSGPWATSNGHQEDIDFSPSFGICCVFTRQRRVKTQLCHHEALPSEDTDSDFDLPSWTSGLYGLYVSIGVYIRLSCSRKIPK